MDILGLFELLSKAHPYWIWEYDPMPTGRFDLLWWIRR